MSDQIKTAEDGKVLIKKEAFRNMITHVLRFGNDAIDDSVEVMGLCLGKSAEGGKEIELINAIPLRHGIEASTGFSKEDNDLFNKIEEQYLSKGLYIVGFYSSHPGWGLFFSDIAIKNHRSFQNNKNPYGFAIVFDHTLMNKEESFGFEIYRLDNYKDKKSNEYQKVNYEIELPNTLEYFKWVQKFVEDTEKNAPILIKEYNELAESVPSDLQEIPQPEGEVIEKDEYSDIAPIISGFQKGGSSFADYFTEMFKPQFGTWTKDIKIGALKGSEILKNIIHRMKEKITDGMFKLEKWFTSNLDIITEDFKNSISEYVDIRINSQKELIAHFSQTKENISNDLNMVIDNNFKNIFNNLESKGKIHAEEIKNSIDKNSKMEEVINKTSDKISTIVNETKEISNNIEKSIPTEISPFEQVIMTEINNLSDKLNNIKETYSQMNIIFQNLQKTINDLQNI